MRRRRLVLGAVTAVLGGCSARERGDPDAPGAGGTNPTAGEAGTASPSSSSTPTPRATAAPTDAAEREGSIESAREHLEVAFDELREMRPVGPENVRVSADRFRASDHERVREAVSAAATALQRVGTADGTADAEGLRAALELARAGVELYASVRRGFRAEWRFERHAFGAEWADASEQADRSAEAIAAWEDHGRAVAEAAVSLRDVGGAPIPRLALEGWYRDGAVLSGVAGPWADVVRGFAAFAGAVRSERAGVAAMDAGEHRRAGERFATAADTVGDAHRRLARAKADGAQAFQSYALPVRRRCGPLREAYGTQSAAAAAAARGESDRADELWTRAMDRVVTAEMENSLPEP